MIENLIFSTNRDTRMIDYSFYCGKVELPHLRGAEGLINGYFAHDIEFKGLHTTPKENDPEGPIIRKIKKITALVAPGLFCIEQQLEETNVNPLSYTPVGDQ